MKLDIIIPVGPGHQEAFNEAVHSVKIACLAGQGPFDEIKIKGVDDTNGESGRSAARNHAIKKSKADWLFFLDADDFMHPMAFINMEKFLDYDAVWGQIAEYKDHTVVERLQMPIIRDFNTLLEVDPYMTLQMGFFVKREKIPLFDESMDTGEDWKVYLELWKSHKCTKASGIFMVNRKGMHSEGPRAATGREWNEVVSGLIEAEK